MSGRPGEIPCWNTRQYVEAWCSEWGGTCPRCGRSAAKHYPAPVGLPPEIDGARPTPTIGTEEQG